MARLNVNGTLDTTFNPNVNSTVNSLAIQKDGQIVIGGLFATVGGVSRAFLARLSEGGTLDATFTASTNATVNGLALQPDGKILLAGSFTTANSTTRNYLARLNANGTLDAGFDPNASASVSCVAVQPDGRVLLGGTFTTMSGTARNRLARVGADGALDASFNPNVNGTVQTMVLQADGRILIGGTFSTVGGVARGRIARLNSNGSLDTSFNPVANVTVGSISLQPDGRIVVGGSFTTIAGIVRNSLARLENEPASQSLTVTTSNRVEWLRGGSSPETLQVDFHSSNDGGVTWATLGEGTRIAGGWELSGLNLTSNLLVRGRARILGGTLNGSSTLVEAITSYGPDLRLADAAQNQFIDQLGNLDFGKVNLGTLVTETITITNPGNTILLLGTITKEGTNSDDFTIVPPANSSVLPGSSTTFKVSFQPTARGQRNASIHLASNVSGMANPFDLTLTGAANSLPTLQGYAIKTMKEIPVTDALANILYRASDADGDTLTLISISPTSALNGPLLLNANDVTYTPPPGFTGLDNFSVSISDGQGGIVQATIIVTVIDPGGVQGGTQAGAVQMINQQLVVLFFGIQDQLYKIQRSTDLQHWTTLTILIGDGDGTILYIDPTPPAGSAFYRTAVPVP